MRRPSADFLYRPSFLFIRYPAPLVQPRIRVASRRRCRKARRVPLIQALSRWLRTVA